MLRTPRKIAVASLVIALGLAMMVATPATAKKSSKLRVSWGDTSFVTGKGYAVRGKLSGPKKRKVTLQYQVKTGWRNLDSTRTRRQGKFKIKGSWDWIGKHRMRLYAPPTRSHRAQFSKIRKFNVTPGYAPRGDRKNYKLMQSRGRTFRFDPCRVVKVRVNTAGVGNGYLPEIKSALKRVSAASGLNLRYVGKTTIKPFKTTRFKNKANLIIDFATSKEYPRFNSSIGGVGGWRYATTGRQRGGFVWQIKYAGVLVNLDTVNGYDPGFISPRTYPIGKLFLHEIGHAVGLLHASGGPDGIGEEVMSGKGWLPDSDGVFRARYGAGDFSGLRTRGLDQGCIKSTRRFSNARTVAGSDSGESIEGEMVE